jgi:hypothetical protein
MRMRQDLQDIYSEWLMKGAERGCKRDLEIRRCPYREGEAMLIFSQSNMHMNGQGNRITLSRVFHTWGQSTQKKTSKDDIYRLKNLLKDIDAEFEEMRNTEGENYISGLGA